MKIHQDRRDFLIQALGAFSIVTVGGCQSLRAGRAALSGGPKSSEPADVDSENAKLLEYTHELPPSHPQKGIQLCANCKYYKGDAQAKWGPCALISSGWVSTQGWCNVWKATGSTGKAE